MNELFNNLAAITNNKFIQTLIIILAALVAQVLVKSTIAIVFNNKLGHLSRGATLHRHYQHRRLKTIGSLINALAIFGIWFIAILVFLKVYKIPYAPLLTSAGLIGAALAFGMQSMIKDLVSGIFIILENQYRVDDYVELDKVSGRVERISMRTTAIRDDNGSLHHVPNGSIVNTTNLSMGRLLSTVQIEFSRDISLEQLHKKIEVINQKIAADPEYSLVIKEDLHIKNLDQLTKDKMIVSLSFATTASKRKNAATIIWTLIAQEKLPLS